MSTAATVDLHVVFSLPPCIVFSVTVAASVLAATPAAPISVATTASAASVVARCLVVVCSSILYVLFLPFLVGCSLYIGKTGKWEQL